VGLSILKETLERNSLLREVNLLFMNCGITPKSFEDVVKGLKKKDCLQKLNFSCSFYDDE